MNQIIYDHGSLVERFSHETRTSMTGIIGFSEYIENVDDDSMLRFTAKIIHESGKEVMRTVGAYCDILRYESGNGIVGDASFSVAKVVNDAICSVKTFSDVKGIKIILGMDDAVWSLWVWADIYGFRKLIDSLFFDFACSSIKDDLIQMDVEWCSETSSLKIKVKKSSKRKDAAWRELMRQFWMSADYVFQSQEGPGVSGALAKLMIHRFNGDMAVQSIGHDGLELSVAIPLKTNREYGHG